MNSLPMILRFVSGSVTPASLLHESFRRIDCNQTQSKIVAQVLLYFFELVLAQHAVVDENASQPRFPVRIAQRPIHQHRRDRGIHSA